MKILFLMALALGTTGLTQSGFASEPTTKAAIETCKEAVALKAAQTAQSFYGSDLTDVECLAGFNTILAISNGRYSVNVDCGELETKTFDVTVESRSDTFCLAPSATEEDSNQ